ncbi:11285_t:CDS:2 [Funneliformis mosseae]|uniref:11285_t:CDS:1 n=1 Tax=Funneliformis mosseae TaxID=27381 RepID=A0A9N8ZJT8_FUNMO|nr:11285_t:CDS:2 [Funneliformis mosseae]
MSLLSFLEHTSIWSALLTLCLLSYTRTFHVVFTIAGGAFTKATASTLKLIIRQPRPYHMTIRSPSMTTKLRKSYGMPSSHSAISIYFATFVSLRLFDSGLLPLYKLLSSLLVYIIALLILWSRVELGHHTTAQVLMGMFLGIILAMYWNDLWVNYWTPLLYELKLDGQLGLDELEVMWNLVDEFINKRIGLTS